MQQHNPAPQRAAQGGYGPAAAQGGYAPAKPDVHALPSKEEVLRSKDQMGATLWNWITHIKGMFGTPAQIIENKVLAAILHMTYLRQLTAAQRASDKWRNRVTDTKHIYRSVLEDHL